MNKRNGTIIRKVVVRRRISTVAAVGSALLSPVAPILKMCGLGGAVKSVGEFGRGFVTGVAKGLASTCEGLYNLVVHPLDTLGGMATMAGVAVVGYANPVSGFSAEQRLQKFDDFFGTNLAVVNEGIKQSLEETGDKFLHGTNAERGEVVGQAVEFIAELVVGTKGAGAAMKAVKAGSMGSKVTKLAKGQKWAEDVVVKQAKWDADIAKEVGHKLEYHVPTEEKAKQLRTIFKKNDIDMKVTPKK